MCTNQRKCDMCTGVADGLLLTGVLHSDECAAVVAAAETMGFDNKSHAGHVSLLFPQCIFVTSCAGTKTGGLTRWSGSTVRTTAACTAARPLQFPTEFPFVFYNRIALCVLLSAQLQVPSGSVRRRRPVPQAAAAPAPAPLRAHIRVCSGWVSSA